MPMLQCSNVPASMFLEWIPQIISLLDFNNVCLIDKLLLRLSAAYPMAIFYPFHLSFTQYKQNNANDNDDGLQLRPVITEILQAIRNPQEEKFMAALLCFSIPEKMLYYHLINLYRELQSNLTQLQFKKSIQNLLHVMYNGEHCQLQGESFKYIVKYEALIRDLLTLDGEFATIVYKRK